MAGYHGGQAVKRGFYLKRSTWEFESVAGRGGILPGNEETSYSRLPLPAVMVAGPLMGLAYAISIPTVYCLSFVYSLARLVGQKLKITEHKDSVLTDKVR